MDSQRYRIVVRGQLSERLGSAFQDMTLQRHAARTVLIGGDGQARLDSVLARLNDLGMEPLSLEPDD